MGTIKPAPFQRGVEDGDGRYGGTSGRFSLIKGSVTSQMAFPGSG